MIVSDKIIDKNIIPAYLEEIWGDANLKVFCKKDIQKQNKIFKEIKKGNFIVFMNLSEKEIYNFYQKLLTRIDDFLDYQKMSEIRDSSFRRNRKKAIEDEKNKILQRILIKCQEDEIVSFKEQTKALFLFSFLGNNCFLDGVNSCSSETNSFLCPYKLYFELKQSLETKYSYQINSQKIELSASVNVLPPKSKDTVEIFDESIKYLSKNKIVSVLDMGCGSGMISFILNEYFQGATITLTDILAESLASAKYNFYQNYQKLPFF